MNCCRQKAASAYPRQHYQGTAAWSGLSHPFLHWKAVSNIYYTK